MLENTSLVSCVWTLPVLMITVMFSPAVGAALFAVNVTQDVYEAEENSDVTLTWFFTVSRDTRPQDLIVDILRHEPGRGNYFIVHVRNTSQYVDQFYRGRFSCNKELFETGRIECVFRNVTVNDSGPYRCVVIMDSEGDTKLCVLNVMAASHHPEQDQPKPVYQVRKRFGADAGFGLFLVVVAALFCRWRFHKSRLNNIFT